MKPGRRTVVVLCCAPSVRPRARRSTDVSSGSTDSSAPTTTPTTTGSVDTSDSGETATTPTTTDWAEARGTGPQIQCSDPTKRATQPYDLRVDADVPNTFNWLHGGGIVVADFDADGYHDILTPNETGAAYYKGTDGGSLTTSRTSR